MQLFERFKKFIACFILIAFIPSQAWAQGITIPSGASLNINTNQLSVPGDININNSGTLQTTSGTVTLTGNWTNAGTFTAGTGTVNLSAAAGTQNINSGGTASNNAFYNLNHNGAGTVLLNSNALAINQNFNNSLGVFNANSEDIDVEGDWENSATFTPGVETVTLNAANGVNQSVLGSTTFYKFSKTVSAPSTLYFDSGGTQNFINGLTLEGTASNLLSIRSTTNGTAANIALTLGKIQVISYVDVRDSNAGNPATQQELVARNSTDQSAPSFNNTNWAFGNANLKWMGNISSEWGNPLNWSPNLVPAAGDSVEVQALGGAVTNEPDLCPPPGGRVNPCSAANIGNLTIDANATLSLSGQNLTVSLPSPAVGAFVNNGTLVLDGTETVAVTQDITNHGTFEYIGDGTSNPLSIIPFSVSGSADYYNLLINDANASQQFNINTNIKTVGNVTITSGNLNIVAATSPTPTYNLTVGETLSLSAAGALSAANGNLIDNGSVTLANGATFTAPGTSNTFTITGDFTNNAGNYVSGTHPTGFNNSSGTVTLNGGNGSNQHLNGATTFYNFIDSVSSGAATLTFDGTGSTVVQTFIHSLTLSGNSSNNLLIRSSTGTASYIALSPGGTQTLNYLDVQYSNASGGIELVAYNSLDHSNFATYQNTNWLFGAATETWVGGTAGNTTNWSTASNWNLGIVPMATDTVTIPGGTTYEPALTAPVAVANLTIGSGVSASTATLTLNGYALTVSPLGANTFNNNGTLILQGNEKLILTMDSTHGTFDYVGDGNSTSDPRTLSICSDVSTCSDVIAFNNLTINDTNATPANRDSFVTGGAVTVNGNLTDNSGTFDASVYNLAVSGNVGITSPGIFKAPGSGKTFTLTGNFSNSGTFNNSSGTVTLNGTNQSVLGTTTFYDFIDNVTSGAATLTFDGTGPSNVQTFTDNLTLKGNGSNNLLIRSSTGSAAYIALSSGGTQVLTNLDVEYSNASLGVELIANSSLDHSDNSTYHNTNWLFGAASLTWIGGAAGNTTNWNTASNWNLGIVPRTGDAVIILGGTTYEPVLTSATPTLASLTIGSGSGASLTLNGNNLTVTAGAGNFVNNGNLKLDGTETVHLTQDPVASDTGTFTYVGDGTSATIPIISFGSPDYNNIVFNSPTGNTFQTSSNITVLGNVGITAGTLDIATHNNTLSVGGNWANSGTLLSSSGTVAFINPAITSIISGTTTFNNFTSTASGKTIEFTAGSAQTVNGTFLVQGVSGNPIILKSTLSGTQWNILFPNGTQTQVHGITVTDSNAETNNVTCLNCNIGTPTPFNDSVEWIFDTLSLAVPAIGTTVGQTPTIIGVGPSNTNIEIKGIVSNVSTVVATVKSDADGNFRVVVGQDRAQTGTVPHNVQLDAIASNSLTAEIISTSASAYSNTITVISTSPTPTTDVPVISKICTAVNSTNCPDVTAGVQFITGSKPTIIGQGALNEPVTIMANTYDSNNNLVLTAVGSGNTDPTTGAFSVTLTTPLPSLTNFLSATVGMTNNETASSVIQVSLTDPFGYVFDSSSGNIIPVATVTIYRADHTMAQPSICDAQGHITTLKDLACTDINPFITGPTSPNQTPGLYNFLARPGNYYLTVTAADYKYPSSLSTFPSPYSDNVIPGSKGDQFTVGNAVAEIDQPMDTNGMLLHIVKTDNKSEAMVGDIVMYTINITNTSSDNVNGIIINDKIPPGFKYIQNRVLLNNASTSNPSGERPLLFNVGNMSPGAQNVLQYQLVIGSGATMGIYQNTAIAQYSTGLPLSNPAQSSVKVIPDPVFDLGDVIGKVFFDWNENGIQDPPFFDPVSHETIVEKPVPNVQIVMEDGTVITTDRNGQYNIPGLLPGRHLFRVDERTLPPGAYLTTPKATIVDVTAGGISKVNFGVNIDETQTKGRDAVFFNEKIRLTQDRNRPVPRLNAALFNTSSNAKADTEEVVLNEGALVRQAEFRIFTNYSPFLTSWRLDILDTDTGKTIRSFEGTPLNINDPIYWNGRDDHDIIINPDHKYSYVVNVIDSKGISDDSKEKPITIREIKDDDALKKERTEDKDVLKDRADRYRKWLDAQELINNLNHQLIDVRGETIHIDRQGTDVKSLRVLKGNDVFTDIPLSKQYGLTPEELIAGGFSTQDEKDNLEIILPNGDYSLDVVSAKTSSTPGVEEVPESVPTSGGMPSRTLSSPSPGMLEHYSRPLKVGEDYMMFVALGDAQVGYNIDRGNIEAVQDNSANPGFYEKGKAAYYLKGQILGKYLITSSYDTDRQTKALFRQLDPNVYYPVYGDGSSINYDAADTQGPLYLKVEWDKSKAILGNYAVDFNDTEFAAFSQKYYGGMIDYKSVASNPYGDARTKIVVYHAQIQQLPSHNEFLATGGSLYFLKYMNVVQGSDTVTIQVRDQTTGLVMGSQTLTNGADYELDNSQGRILFWQPVAMIAQANSIISNNLVDGDPIYVVVDYQYAVSGMQVAGSQGARVAQAVGDNVVLGGTYVTDDSNGQHYSLEGTDATLHVDHDTTLKAEYAETKSQETGSYVSTDGGISFTSLMLDSTASGKAYGIKGDTRLFDDIGLKSYYKWVGSDFGTTDTTYQQGKESMGLSLTWDMTPVTRLTASEDIQKLLAGSNLQASTQVGATETDTTMVQIVHTAERLKLTGQFQLIETKSVIDGIQSTTNQRGATVAGQAQYDLTNRVKLTVGQQVDVINKNNTATTLGIADRVSDHTTLNAQEVFSSQGHALTAGVTNQLTKKIALTTDYTLTNLNTGEVDKTASVGVSDQITKNIMTTGTVAQTASSNGTNTTSASIGTKAKISDSMTMDLSLGKVQNSLGGVQGGTSVNLNGTTQVNNTTITGTASASAGTPVSDALSIGTTGITTTSSFGVQATTKVDEKNSTNGSVSVADESTGQKTTTVGFGNTSKLDQELQAVTSNSFSFSPDNGSTDASKYGILRDQNGQKLEGDFTKQSAFLPTSVSQSNIYGLSGDVNDKLALNGSIESGKVQNLDGTQTDRTDFTFGSGYVLKDTLTAEAKLKNSFKFEFRVDKGKGTGADSYHQFVIYDAIEGKVSDNVSLNAKLDYSKTLDVSTGAVAERHQEIILGMAYRPVTFDKLNLITEYSYQDGYGGGLNQADALNSIGIQTVAQVFSGEAVYDINDKWQAAEKIAYRIENEQDTGFAFTQTHTWLVIHRLNYKVDRNWTISGEYRDLTQVEAKDSKQGVLLEATRDINDNTQLSIGWNFTDYTDDLTNLSYSSFGPFVRIDGKFYDESPEERARARAKWLDAKISDWAWVMIRKELAKKDSKIVLELNRMFALAKQAQSAGRLEESRQIYKDIIAAGQMMFDEASEYIRNRINFEEQMQQLDKTAQEYFKGGEYVKARKIWEKVVEDASKGVVK